MPRYTSPALQQRIRDLLSTVRVGVDFGQHAGGIAVVRDNEVLHAETFLDFHEATLEQRRILRRGRRSRHAKKMRLARLRSWVLRQKLPDGKRLSDPYLILRNPEYMVQPGVYKQKGSNPRDSISWVQLAKEGKTDAAGFVRALTLIFQKRGYKWDAIALEEMSDAKLKEFLMTARIPTDDPAFAEQIRTQIERRRINPDLLIRGKNKCSVEELESCLQFACERGKQAPRPRLAEHRSVKEADLRGVVDGFARAKVLTTVAAERWKQELCGLLNKAIRPARFENRLKTGCAWCGRATPRKAKVKEIAYRAAVNNLRTRENFRFRPLTEEERKPFLDWWTDPKSAPGAKSIAERLAKLNSEQKGMAGQFHDLLKNEKPKGRASLCAEHLKMAGEGKTMKDAGVEWQTIAVRKAPNPCGERRDARVLHRLEQILFLPEKRGVAAWRYGPVSTISLEIPDPDTEQQPKAKRTERQIETLKERLAKETEGCIYKIFGGCGGETDKDHIFPRSRGGPDVRFNLVSACMAHNKEKDNRTPFEWISSNGGDAARWGSFKNHVMKLGLPERKKAILLNETNEYPEADPTALARIGSRPRQFVVALRAIFEKRGLPAPRYDYRVGEPLIQQIRGSETRHFRLSWSKKSDGSANFPFPKERSTLFNHAEDAAILAAIPPHTWRDFVFCFTSDRPNWKGEVKPRPGLAVPELAPDWRGFLVNREKPLVRILGDYPVNWKTRFADLTFWRQPHLDTRRLKRYKLLKDVQSKDLPNIISAPVKSQVEKISAFAGLDVKGTIAEALAQKLAGEGAKRPEREQKIPQALEELEKKYPVLRRLQISSQKGGTIARISPSDGPTRKVQIKPASEGVIVWSRKNGKKDKIGISVIRPKPLQAFGIPRVDPPIPQDASVFGQLRRHQIIWIDGQPDHPDGFYLVTKCQKGGITVQPEEVVPAEILRRTGVKLGKLASEDTDDDGEDKVSFGLGKQALVKYFESKKPRDAN